MTHVNHKVEPQDTQEKMGMHGRNPRVSAAVVLSQGSPEYTGRTWGLGRQLMLGSLTLLRAL